MTDRRNISSMLQAVRAKFDEFYYEFERDASIRLVLAEFKRGVQTEIWQTRKHFSDFLGISHSMQNRLFNHAYGRCKKPGMSTVRTMVAQLGLDCTDLSQVTNKRQYLMRNLFEEVPSIRTVFDLDISELTAGSMDSVDEAVSTIGDFPDECLRHKKKFMAWIDTNLGQCKGCTTNQLRMAAAWMFIRKRQRRFEQTLMSLAGKSGEDEFRDQVFLMGRMKTAFTQAFRSVAECKSAMNLSSQDLSQRVLDKVKKQLYSLEVKRDATVVALLERYGLEQTDLIKLELGVLIMKSSLTNSTAIRLLRDASSLRPALTDCRRQSLGNEIPSFQAG